MRIIAIDPGPADSAIVVFEGGDIVSKGDLPNDVMRERLKRWSEYRDTQLVVEMIASYGMPVGAEVFDTCVWIGRFIEAWGANHALMFRRDVKLHLCGSPRANDGNVRQALIDRFGPGKEKAIGKKASPGPLYGIKGDEWAALAVAITYADQHAAVIRIEAKKGESDGK